MRFGFHHRGGRHGHHHSHEEWHAMRGGFGRGRGFEHFMAHFAEGREGRGGGRRRLFDGGELRLVLLRLIGDMPRHGYDLIRAIEERTGGVYAPSPGVVYPTLTMLGDMGQIEEQASDGNRKVFAATAEGHALLTEKAEEIAELMARLDALGEFQSRSDSGPVRRAMANLHTVIRSAIHNDDQADIVHDIAQILDEAARKIERL